MTARKRNGVDGGIEVFSDDLVGHIDVIAKLFAEYLKGRGKIL